MYRKGRKTLTLILQQIALFRIFLASSSSSRIREKDTSCIYFLRLTSYENRSPSKMHVCEFEDGEEVEIHNIENYYSSLISGESKLIFPEQNVENDILTITDGTLEITKNPINIFYSKKKRRTIGTRKVVAIRVDAIDSSTTMSKKEIRKRMFGNSSKKISLKSQYAKCSFNKLKLKPFDGKTNTKALIKNGVGEVSIPIKVIGASKADVVKAVNQAAKEKYGGMHQFDHFIYCLPPGTGDWLAVAIVNGRRSVFNDKWCDNLTTLMHEIGHNLNLGHSGEGNKEYAVGSGKPSYSDESCPMGFGSYNLDLIEEGVDVQKCFNGAKSWQLGWYEKGHAVVNSDSPYFEGNLIGLVYFNKLKSDKVLVKIEGNENDYYVAFNHKAKFNSMTLEGTNLVLITSRSPTKKSASSRLQARLDQGDRYIVEGTYSIEVKVINKSSKRYFAKIKISADFCASNSDCDDGNVACTVNQCSEKGLCVTQQDCSKCDKTPIEVDVMTDSYPNQTSWDIINLENKTVKVVQNDPIQHKFAQYKKQFCLQSGKYKFTMYKSGEETLTKNREGYYALVVDGEIMKNDILSSGTKDTKSFTI